MQLAKGNQQKATRNAKAREALAAFPCLENYWMRIALIIIIIILIII